MLINFSNNHNITKNSIRSSQLFKLLNPFFIGQFAWVYNSSYPQLLIPNFQLKKSLAFCLLSLAFYYLCRHEKEN